MPIDYETAPVVLARGGTIAVQSVSPGAHNYGKTGSEF
jgi:hypothetical protein